VPGLALIVGEGVGGESAVAAVSELVRVISVVDDVPVPLLVHVYR